jgi:tRNA-dihydrouridine synthase
LKPACASPWLVEPEHNVASAARIHAATRLPVVVAGGIPGPAQAERILERGSADLAGMVRALIADPELPRRTREGRMDEIRSCLDQNECDGFHGAWGHLVCAVDPVAGREDELAFGRDGVGRHVARLPKLDHVAGYMERRRRQLDGREVEVRLERPATEAAVEELRPDVAIVATGAVPLRPAFTGSDSERVLTAGRRCWWPTSLPSGARRSS